VFFTELPQCADNINIGVSEGWLDESEASDMMANTLVSKGYAYIEMEDYDNAITELNQARDISSNPNSLMNALIQSTIEAGRQKRNLGVQDAMARDTNQNALASFLSTVKLFEQL